MHGHRKEEDGITVVGPRACAEVLLHGLHNREQLMGEIYHVMEHHLHQGLTQWKQIDINAQSLPCKQVVLPSEFNTQCFSHIEMG